MTEENDNVQKTWTRVQNSRVGRILSKETGQEIPRILGVVRKKEEEIQPRIFNR